MGTALGAVDEKQVLDELADIQRQASILEAARIRLLARYQDIREQDDDHATRSIPDEIALELHISRHYAQTQLKFARDLTERLPDTLDAMHAGRVDLFKARALLEVTELMSVED